MHDGTTCLSINYINYIYCVIFSSRVHICGLHQLLRNKMITFEIGTRTESLLEQVICHLIKEAEKLLHGRNYLIMDELGWRLAVRRPGPPSIVRSKNTEVINIRSRLLSFHCPPVRKVGVSKQGQSHCTTIFGKNWMIICYVQTPSI